MRKVSDPIREGAEGFLRVQYGVILKLAIFVTIGIFFSYKLRDFDEPTGIEVLGSNVMGAVGSVSFVLVSHPCLLRVDGRRSS
jgi:Na+/H+-translocating membrane pyrophosphatase